MPRWYVLAVALVLGLGLYLLAAAVGSAVNDARLVPPSTEPTVAGTVVTRP